MHSHLILLKYLGYFSLGLFFGGCFGLDRASIEESDAGITPCYTCTLSHCAAEVSACWHDKSCWSRHECLTRCDADDANCRIECSKNIALTDLSLALDSCRSAHCRELCDNCGASMFDGRGAACSACMQKGEQCVATAKCADDLECSRRMRSRMACRDPYCAVHDGLPYDSAREVYRSPLRDALDQKLRDCHSECNMGTDFSCAFWYSTPKESELLSESTVIELEPTDVLEDLPLSSVNIEAWLDDTGASTRSATEFAPGKYSVEVPGIFRGSLHFQKEGYFPLHAQIGRHLLGSEVWAMPMTSLTLLKDFAQLLDKDIDLEENGVLIIVAIDCTNTLAPGVVVEYALEFNPDSKIVRTTSQGVPFADGEPSVTDKIGSVLYLNVPPGKSTVEYSTETAGNRTGGSHVLTTKGTISFVVMYPSGLTMKKDL